MRPLYTEFSFGFGIAHEVQNRIHSFSIKAPIFPSLLDEKRVGWDVHFRLCGCSLFLQFKRSDALTRSTATQWPIFNSSFYRFPVYRRTESPQHNLLVRLAQREPHVYYCAPLFYKDGDFNTYFMRRNLLKFSLFLPAHGLPEITDDEQHYIAYNASGLAYFCSEPFRVEGAETGDTLVSDVVNYVRNDEDHEEHRITYSYLVELWLQMAHLVSESGHFHRQTLSFVEPDLQDPPSLIRAIRLVSRTYFGAEWMVLTESVPRRALHAG